MPRASVTRFFLHRAECSLEPFVSESLDLAAVVADEMVMVLTTGLGRLEAHEAVADIDALDISLFREKVERAVDSRQPHA